MAQMRTVHGALAPIAGALLLLAFLVALAVPSQVGAQAKTLGATPQLPAPACPTNTNRNPCEAIGSVTGFQVVGRGQQGLMRAREDGHLLAWAIRTSRPTNEQQRFFGNFYAHDAFGTRPHARIAILRRLSGNRFRLLRQGPVVDLTPGLGQRQIFTLTEPLRIRQGQILALTVPTWSPSFAVNLAAQGNIWRASRRQDRCTGVNNIRRSRTHANVGVDRQYGCTYRTARLLYWGFYVADE